MNKMEKKIYKKPSVKEIKVKVASMIAASVTAQSPQSTQLPDVEQDDTDWSDKWGN
jgi:hypothetical protein